MIAAHIFTLLVFTNFGGVLSGSGRIHIIPIQTEKNPWSPDEVCLIEGSKTKSPVSVEGVPRRPGDICKERCQAYHRCSAVENYNIFIAKGTKTKYKEFPHMALIGYKKEKGIEWNCGGSLISENFVLTAAHCLRDRYGKATNVVLGLTDTNDTSTCQYSEVIDRIHHPEYKEGLMYHDIGLLRLSSTIYFNEFVKPVCLHLKEDTHLLQQKADVVGWGTIHFNSQEQPTNLLKAKLKFYDHEQCNECYTPKEQDRSFSPVPHGVLEDIMICAGSYDKVQGPCQGDSGGPLQVHNGENYVLVGVTSYGKPCGYKKNTPNIFTRVSFYVNWIEEHVWSEYLSVSMLYR